MKKFLSVCLLSLLIQNFFLIPINANEDDANLVGSEYNAAQDL